MVEKLTQDLAVDLAAERFTVLLHTVHRRYHGCYHTIVTITLYVERTSCETPTVMHIAAKNALRHLSEKLLDLPNSNHACQLCNIDGRRPSELAAVYGCNDLASRLTPHVSL